MMHILQQIFHWFGWRVDNNHQTSPTSTISVPQVNDDDDDENMTPIIANAEMSLQLNLLQNVDSSDDDINRIKQLYKNFSNYLREKNISFLQEDHIKLLISALKQLNLTKKDYFKQLYDECTEDTNLLPFIKRQLLNHIEDQRIKQICDAICYQHTNNCQPNQQLEIFLTLFNYIVNTIKSGGSIQILNKVIDKLFKGAEGYNISLTTIEAENLLNVYSTQHNLSDADIIFMHKLTNKTITSEDNLSTLFSKVNIENPNITAMVYLLVEGRLKCQFNWDTTDAMYEYLSDISMKLLLKLHNDKKGKTVNSNEIPNILTINSTQPTSNLIPPLFLFNNIASSNNNLPKNKKSTIARNQISPRTSYESCESIEMNTSDSVMSINTVRIIGSPP